MLPPQLRQTLLPSSRLALATLALKASTPSVLHPRSFWSWRRDWTSHLDPVYHRFSRIRTLKTRAKLLKNLRRRGKFDWDFDSKPFFTPRLVRCASHWDGSGRRKVWFLDAEEGKKTKDANGTSKTSAEEDTFELSAREKVWREKMEAWRKRIEKDPYEAVFGKRFEPFWSPLVPSWMREEMGLQGWPKSQKESPKEPPKATPEAAMTKTGKNDTGDEAKSTEPEVPKKEEPTSTTASIEPKSTSSSRPASYSYASSTSWDSWTNKTRRVEWDSMSGQTRKFEYDPISNRMIQVEAPKPTLAEAESISASTIGTGSPTTAESSNSNAGNIPVKQSTELRKSIPIPPPLSSSSVGFSRSTVTSIGPWKTTAVASDVPKPSALTKLPEKQLQVDKEVESLTADQVRASMGKSREPSTKEVETEECDMQVAAILQEHDLSRGRVHVSKAISTQWDQAETSVMLDKELENLQKKKEKLLKDERGLFHIERQKRELQKLDDRINEVTARVDKLNLTAGAVESKQPSAPPAVIATKASGLQSSLDRMQSKELPTVIDPDDAAAHESTEAICALNGVPKNWAQQAELLQADRVRRTASKRPYPMSIPVTRWEDDMKARQAAHESAKIKEIQESEKGQADARKREMLEKANKMLEAEVAEQKMKMQAHETRYAHKIRSLRQELEVAYKQSTVHAEKHLERVRYLEQELEKALKAAAVPNKMPEDQVAEQKMKMQATENRYAHKIRALRQELDVAYKQSTVHSEQHLERVQYLEQELEKALKAAGPSSSTTPIPKPVDESLKIRKREKAEQNARAIALVKEVKQIYEKEYGVIDVSHRQPQMSKRLQPQPDLPAENNKQVVEVESDVDLGEALARYESDAPPYTFPQPGLENEVAAQEREFYEERKLVDDKVPKLIPTEVAKMAAEEAAAESKSESSTGSLPVAVQWEEPPVYKVLAYDSGNDMMSTATTTSNFTGAEAPISIPQALSQLYQPARFVPYFAELQKDGYQVIFGTKDLLVFKKVKGPFAATPPLEDHGLFNVETGAEASHVRIETSAINPIDGTMMRTPPEPSTGNFASPTCFVNHDPIIPVEKNSGITTQQEDYEDPEIEWRHYPRVRRMEQHFTGSRRRWNTGFHRRGSRRFEDKDRETRRRHRRDTIKWILGVALGTATVTYMVGAVAESARESKEVDWARRAEEERKRWRGL